MCNKQKKSILEGVPISTLGYSLINPSSVQIQTVCDLRLFLGSDIN